MSNKKALKYLRQANTHLNNKEPKTALPLYRKAVTLDSLLHQAHYGIAACHVSLSSTAIDEAVMHITKALQIYPTTQYLDCAALVFLAKGIYHVALHYQLQALKIEPTAENIFKASDMYKKLGMYSEALNTVLPLVGTSEEAPLQIPMHMASIYLTCGQYLNGWEGWEWRRTKKGFYRNYEECEYWDGKKEPNVIFLYGEQGFGDIIQFSRFILTFKDRYPNTKIIYESSSPLRELFKENFPLDEIVDTTEKPSGFDAHCSLLSLAHRFQIEVNSIPYTDGYLKPNEEKKAYWKQRLEETSNHKLKVGLVWHGQAVTKTGVDQRRNIPLSLFEDMIIKTKEDISWYSLQKEIKPERKNLLYDHTDDFKDFSDTAAFISNLDLVIAVDTAVAHLSGALGVNTWLLSRMDGCWRWGNAEDNKMRTPWYNSVRVFRQHEWLDWRSTINEVHFALTTKHDKRKLPEVTLVVVDCVDYERAKKVVDHCCSFFVFADVKILTHFNVDDSRVHHIPEIKTIEEYSDFCIRRIGDYFDTSHVLLVQHDGYIVNPTMWSDDFLAYDYIGAPWPQAAFHDSLMWAYHKEWVVGNGGFSLRSKKLYSALADLTPEQTHCEDTILCIHLREVLENKYSIVFAPKDIAANFSIEHNILGTTKNLSFGQHGIPINNLRLASLT